MIQNVLMTSVTPLCNTNETHCWDNRPFTAVWPEADRHQKSQVGKTIKKKPKRARTAFSTDQLRALERCFSKNKYIDTDRRRDLAKSLNIGEKCVKVWFQNRRMKEKRESSESSSESSNDTIHDVPPALTTPPEPIPYSPNLNQNHYYPYYQMPYFYPYAGDYANIPNTTNIPNSSSNIPPFYNDSTVYPTQYYPSVEHNIADTQSYWPADNNDLCYF